MWAGGEMPCRYQLHRGTCSFLVFNLVNCEISLDRSDLRTELIINFNPAEYVDDNDLCIFGSVSELARLSVTKYYLQVMK